MVAIAAVIATADAIITIVIVIIPVGQAYHAAQKLLVTQQSILPVPDQVRVSFF